MPARQLGKICTAVAATTCEEMVKKAQVAFSLGSEIVEFRVDKLEERTSAAEAKKRLGRFATKSIVTVRSKEEGGGFMGTEEERLKLISGLAAELSPAYFDVELATVKANLGWFRRLTSAASRPDRMIISWHDFSGTPDFQTLSSLRKEAMKRGDIAKIVTMAKSPDDNLTLLMLYQEDAKDLVAFCMGQEGTASRILSLQLGSPVVYASLPGEPVAPGQLSVVTVKAIKKMLLAKAARKS
ncbi:MAG: type I 3-dehydroquinate dehydratase [Thaumarchaeota archaeon]|nr:type I 3-dehydroquinate dehydratase [Nitrososphaerota archaeon]